MRIILNRLLCGELVWRIADEKNKKNIVAIFLQFSTSFSLLDIFYIFMHF
jgi:hypothetical protein